MSASNSSASRPSCVANEADVKKLTLLDRFGAEGLKHGVDGIAEVYNATRQMLARATGAQKLGCSLMTVAPGGCTAFPYHAHASNEEAIYVLSGEGLMRMPAGDFTVKAGDYVTLLTGEENAHQLWNFHASEPLRYLCVSTEINPDVTVSNAVALASAASATMPVAMPLTLSVCLLAASGPFGQREGLRQSRQHEGRHLHARSARALPERRGKQVHAQWPSGVRTRRLP
jgi:uncharacterized cupin superfamily protein